MKARGGGGLVGGCPRATRGQVQEIGKRKDGLYQVECDVCVCLHVRELCVLSVCPECALSFRINDFVSVLMSLNFNIFHRNTVLYSCIVNAHAFFIIKNNL